MRKFIGASTVRRSAMLLGVGALALSTGQAGAAPFLSVDFNTSTSATQSGFTAFTGGPAITNQPTPVAASFSTAAVSSGAVKVWVSDTASVDASGDLNSTDNNVAFNTRSGPTNSGSFTYANLYHDFVYTNVSGTATYLELSGLDPSTDYAVTLYASDPNTSKTTTITNVTNGGSSAFGTIVSTTTYTNNSDYAATNTVTSSSTGRLIFKASTPTFATINGVEIATTPEPASLGLLSLAGGALLVRRRRK